MSNEPPKQSKNLLDETENGPARMENESLWLTQADIAELFQATPLSEKTPRNATFAESELLSEAATCKDSLQVRPESSRQASRSLHPYHLEAILAMGHRDRGHRGELLSNHPELPDSSKRSAAKQ